MNDLVCFCQVSTSVPNAEIESVKQTQMGKVAAATQVQSAEYLKPLFKTLRSRVSLHFYLFPM